MEKNDRFIQVNGEILPYSVERRRVRNPRLEFRAEGLVVVLPVGWGDETHLLKEKIGWISKKHAQIKAAFERLDKRAAGGNAVPIFGELFEIRRGTSLLFDPARRIIELNPDDTNQKKRLAAMLKKMLAEELHQAVTYYCQRFGVNFKRICIKRHRSKWGSCSFRGNLNFNLRLVHLPRELVWYLACHEVAHLRERGHGKRFWSLVGSEFNNYREIEKKLFEYWFLAQECLNSIFSSDWANF
ncbi:MAG: M48 family metallopeptidase [Candidatus Hadarchaeum sp.]|uniref:M48 family metallopeptidase n=1 Tax=Candidatus Hadarchaeum sp. TaxID=2883567 RepID=UPI003D10DF4E